MWPGYDGDDGGGDFDGAGGGGFTRDDPLLGDLDGGLNADEDDNNGGGLDSSSFKHLKDSIIFLIDAQSSMFEQVVLPSNTHNSQSQQQQQQTQLLDDKKKVFDSVPFYITLNAVVNSYSEKIISSPNDVLGVVFYNCKEKQNQFDFNHVYVSQDLDIPDAKRIKQIESLIYSKSITSNDHVQSNTLHEALWTCQHLFSLSNASSKLGFKRVFLFTGDDNPHRDDQAAKLKSIERGRDLMNSDIEIQLFSLKIPASSFKFDSFWKQMIHVSDDDYTGRIQYDCLENGLLELKEKIRKREFKKRGITSIPFIIGESESQIVLNCTLYSCISKTRKPSAVHLHSDTNKLLKCETKYICTDTGTELMKNGSTINIDTISTGGGIATVSTSGEGGAMNEMVTSNSTIGNSTGNTSNGSGDMIYYYEYGGHKSEFTLEELNNIKHLKNGSMTTGVKNEHVQPGIKLIGFKPKSRLKIYHNYKSSGFLYPNDQKIQGSLLTLSALHKKMIEMNRIAICRFTQREGTMPQFIALLAQEEVVDDESNSQVTPPGFQIIYLPYADGIRKLQEFPNEQTPTDKHIQLAKKIAKKLTIEYNPHEFTNPSLQQFYQSLQALALEHSNIEQIEDVLKPDIEGMKKYEPLMREFNDLIFPPNYDPDSKKTQKKSVKKEEEDSQDVITSTEKKKTTRSKKKPSEESKKRKSEDLSEDEKPKKVKKKAELSESEGEEEEIDMVQLIKDGKADKLKVDILKEFCKQYKLKVSGSKKELIERITEFLKKKKKI